MKNIFLINYSWIFGSKKKYINRINFSSLQIGVKLNYLFYSTSNFCASDTSQSIIPVKFYENVDLQKREISRDNKNEYGT